ncbi:MAG: sulfite exporter TauE/SafE family protein [Candidatus Nitrosoglobus sp.]
MNPLTFPFIFLFVTFLDPLFTTSFTFALLLGLLSALHCIAMCGAIIGTLTLSLPREVRNHKKRLVPFILAYNFGRIVSYITMGLIMGLLVRFLGAISHPVVVLVGISGHDVLQAISSFIMLGTGLYIANWFPRFARVDRLGVPLWRRLEPLGRRLIPVRTLKQAFVFGTIWGWLPCGLVYNAVAVAATTGSGTRSALTMLAFGIGTLPAVMSAGIFTAWMTHLASLKGLRHIAGLLIMAMAIINLLAIVSS